jgi:WD40 repeat protein
VTPIVSTEAPYLGLRFFDVLKAHLFFGRVRQIDDLLDKLGSTRFVAVIGPSGSGKSSLVQAGIIPELKSGWKIARCRPRAHPISELARALESDWGINQAELTLRRGPLGLRDAALQSQSTPDQKYLVVVDQFEELFRFKAGTGNDEASQFVRLLIAATDQNDIDVHVMFTMRSDYLGNCSQFRDLPERLNEGLYLVPRMSRDQLEAAITGPIKLVGASIAPRLVQRLLNDVADDPDQLPVLQHTLLRTWNCWVREGRNGEVDLQHYGNLQSSLEDHAEDIYKGFGDEEKRIAEIMFRCLTEIDEAREIRRPAAFSELVAVSGAASETAMSVLRVFQADNVAFLTPESSVELRPDTYVDITHESLIRQWTRLRGWAKLEEQDGDLYVRVERRARLARGEADYLQGVELEEATKWLDKRYPPPWTNRYGGEHPQTVSFIEKSLHKSRNLEQEQEKLARERRRNRYIGIGAVLGVLFGGVSLWFFYRAQHLAWQFQSEAAAADATELLNSDPERGVLRAAEGVKTSLEHGIDVSPRVEEALVKAIAASRLRVVLPHHEKLNAVSYSPDGGELATASSDGTLRILNPKGTEIALFPHQASVVSVDFSRDGRIVTASEDRTVRVWDEAKRAGILKLDDFKYPIATARFSPDGSHLITETADQTVEIFDASTGKRLVSENVLPEQTELRDPSDNHVLKTLKNRPNSHIPTVFRNPEVLTSTTKLAASSETLDTQYQKIGVRTVYSLAFSPDGELVAISGGDGTISVLRADNLKRICRSPNQSGLLGTINDLAFSPDQKRLATGGTDKTIRLWDVESCKEIVPLRAHEASVTSVRFSRDGKRLVSGSVDRTVRVWNVDPDDAENGWRQILILRGHEDAVSGVAFSPEGAFVASVSADKTARVWDVSPEGNETQTFSAHNGNLTSLAFSPDGQRIATASYDEKVVKVWDLKSNKPLVFTGHTDGVRAVAFSPDSDGKRIATAGQDKTARIWDSATGAHTLTLQGPEIDMFDVAFSPDGKKIATAGADNAVVTVWDANRGTELPLKLTGHEDRLTRVIFSPRGNYIATASCDGTARLWDAGTGKLLQTFGPKDHKCVFGIDFGPDDKTLATAGQNKVVNIWDTRGGKLLHTISGHDGIIYGVAFSKEGKELASASGDKTLRIWSVESGEPLMKLQARTAAPFTTVAFAPNSNRLAAGTTSGLVHLFTLDPRELVAIAEERVFNRSEKH